MDADKDGTADTTESSVAYLYASGRLSGINTATTAYTITYDTFGNMVSVSAGGNVLATYTYTARNGKLTRLTYGNGDYEDYTYDNLDRLVKVTYNGSSTNAFTVLYDSNGRLAKAVDGKVGITYLYEYDSLDRLIRAYQKDSSGNTVFAVENSYDSYGRPTGSTYVIDGTSRTYSIAYKSNTNLVSQYTTPGASFSYNYDSFDRLTSKTNTLFGYTYGYKTGTTLVSSLTVSTNAASTSDVYTYTYNNLGYITNIKKNGTTFASYSYDSLGQMISESNAATGEIYIYTYDKAGNITKKDIYVGDIGNLTDTITYTYGNTAWKDRLTNYDGTAITYDSMGNPTKWVGIAALTWNGRQLTYLSEDGLDHGVAFTYNADGIRTKKVFYDYDGSVTTHNYVLDGTTIVKETVTSGNSTTTLEYYYDESGIVSVRYNGTLYHYIKNLQGDIIGIVNSNNGAFVVEYTYDAWGNILSVTGSLASTVGQINPFRYRGYYYDSETGLYYLNSRYYDAEVGRFINADSYASTGQGILGNNMFAYCGNSPTNRIDQLGENYLDYSGLNSYNEIHNAVQHHIVDTNVGMSLEVRAGTSFLRIDLLDSDGGIYEVKPCTHRNTAGRIAATIQLINYSNLSGYSFGTAYFAGIFEHKEYTITYWTEGSLIFYNFYKTKEKVTVPIPVPVEKKSDVLDKVKSKAKDFIDSVEDYLTTTPGSAGIATGAGCMAVVALGTLARYQLQQKG